jgi:hypothetical protein
MKSLIYSIFIVGVLLLSACSSDEEDSEKFVFLTTPTWQSVDLLVDGEDASGEGQVLEKFKGDAKFYKDGTGYFGEYTGTWGFNNNETELVILAAEIGFPLTTVVDELTATSLKISTVFPVEPEPLNINMTFTAK